MKKRMKKTPGRWIKAETALLLAVVLFGAPIGFSLMNGSNLVFAQAAEQSQSEKTESGNKEEGTADAGSSSASGSESVQDGSSAGTADGTGAEDSLCTCTKKCTASDWNQKCPVCTEGYQVCEYQTPNVRILIETEQDWSTDEAVVKITVEDLLNTGNFVIKSVEAKIGQNGTWTDITESMKVSISENCTVYVRVTDKNGEIYERNRSLKCFDTTRPTLNAAVSDGLLSIQAYDSESGVKAIYVNGYEFTDLTNGVLNIRLQQFDAGYQYFTIQAMDYAGNMSEVYKTANPYYTDPDTESTSDTTAAEQLPVSAQATSPSSATGTVTEHVTTDSDGNTVSATAASSDSTDTEKTSEDTSGSKTATDTSDGKEFYTIQTASDKVFYLVIDRDGENETVYFLTEVSENDLLNTTSDNSEVLPMNSAVVESAIPTDDTALSNNNTGANADGYSSGDEAATSSGDEDTEVTESGSDEAAEASESAEAEKSGINPYLVMAVIGVLIIAGYYFLVIRKKKDEYLDDEEEEENPDIFDDADLTSERSDNFLDDDYEESEEEEASETGKSAEEKSDSDESDEE